MALDVEAVHVALAGQIEAGIARGATGANKDINVAAYPFSASTLPHIEIWPGQPWVEYWGTFGAAGLSHVNVVARVSLVTANGATWLKQASELISAGTGETNSIVDAIMDDVTLGGVVSTCQPDDPIWGDDLETFGQVVDIPVRITLRKTGASV